MKHVLRLITIVAITMSSINAIAEISLYAGLGASRINISGNDGSVDINPDSITLNTVNAKFGAQLTKHLQAEIRGGLGSKDATVEALGVKVDLKLEHFYGAYIKAGVPDLESFFPYILLGYTEIELEGSSGGVSVSESDNDFSYGVGIDFKLSDRVSINTEFANLYDKTSKWNALTAGIVFNF